MRGAVVRNRRCVSSSAKNGRLARSITARNDSLFSMSAKDNAEKSNTLRPQRGKKNAPHRDTDFRDSCFEYSESSPQVITDIRSARSKGISSK